MPNNQSSKEYKQYLKLFSSNFKLYRLLTFNDSNGINSFNTLTDWKVEHQKKKIAVQSKYS